MVVLRKTQKNMTVIINASHSSNYFYFGHFVGAEDIPQSICWD